jgi:hypothetical protein
MENPFKNDEQIFIENKDILKIVDFCCPIGWSELVRQLIKDIRNVCATHKSALPVVLQVKSKFGGLRFYLNDGFDRWDKWDRDSPAGIEIGKLIDEAEVKSYTICEITGQPGSYHVKDRWYATLSEGKAKELGYIKVEQKRT